MNEKLRIGAAAVALAGLVGSGCGDGGNADDPGRVPKGLTIAVIGDTPYGAKQVESFRRDIAQINADPDVRLVIHLGDIQESPSRCEDDYLERIRRDFDTFDDPLVYTPGDNEWTDCHQPNKGGHAPPQRLSRLRATFFDAPGRTLGRRSRRVKAQRAPFVENVRWTQGRAVFTTLHVPGSNNGLAPWSGSSAPSRAQMEDHRSRVKAALAWLDQAFDAARAERAAAVVVAMQADMWPEDEGSPDLSGYEAIVARLARRARAFRRPVLVLQGDSHRFRVDVPLKRGSGRHGVRTAAPNVIRDVVQGATSRPRQWLRVRVVRTPEVFVLDPVRFER